VVPVLTPHGHLILSEDRDASALEPELARRLQNAFARGSGHGLLQLGASEVGVALPPVLSYWREFGARYVTALCTRSVLQSLWQELHIAFGLELSKSSCGVQEFLKRCNAAWNLVGRVHFNLAENRKDDAAPFAFLATYTTRLSAHAKAQHLPLGQALGEYAGAANKDRLLSLLLPVQRASESCSWLKAMVAATIRAYL